MNALPVQNHALCLLSGGLDSTVAMLYAVKRMKLSVSAVIFDYGQRAYVNEFVAASCTCKLLQAPLFSFGVQQLAEVMSSPLTGHGKLEGTSEYNHKLLAPFAPGRNLLLMTMAAIFAYRKGISNVVTGICSTSPTVYPDSRQKAVIAQERAINEGLDRPIHFIHPVIGKTKAGIFSMADELGALDHVVKHTYTGYGLGDDLYQYPWGIGPRDAATHGPELKLRKEGWEEFERNR